jgi:flagellar hook-associated protein 2
MSFTPLTFTGISTYSSDFQTVLERAVKIASLPLTALHNENTDLLARKTQLSAVGNSVSDLTSALESLGKISSEKSLQAKSSNSAIVSVANSGGEAAANYTINSITSLAAPASETSVWGYQSSSTTQVSASGTVKLMVGTNEYTLNLSQSNNNLVGLRNAINALGAGVNASILTTGTGVNPNFLSLSTVASGETTLRLVEDPNGAATELLTADNQGSDAVFDLNGLTVRRTANQVNDVIPGLSFALLDESTTPVTLSLATQKSRLEDGMSSLVTAYNALTDSISAQVGPSAGLLSGDFLVREIQKAQRELSGFTGSMTLADLGVTFAATGKATFDASKIESFTDTDVAKAFSFLGSKTTGFAGLSQRFSQISDPVTGLIKLQQDSYDRTDQRLQEQISTLEARIDELQKSTAQRLQAIDALLGALDGQQKVIDASIQSVNLTLYGKNDS